MIRVPRGAPRALGPLAVPLLENGACAPGPVVGGVCSRNERLRGLRSLCIRKAESPVTICSGLERLCDPLQGGCVAAWLRGQSRQSPCCGLNCPEKLSPLLPAVAPRAPAASPGQGAQDRVREPGSPRWPAQPPPGRLQAACGECGCCGPRCRHRRSSDKQTFPAEEPTPSTAAPGGPVWSAIEALTGGARGAAREARVHTEGLLWTKADT